MMETPAQVEKAERPGSSSQQSEEVDQAPSSDVPRLGSARSISIIGATSLGMLMNIASITSMFIALPSIGRDLDINPNNLQWLVTSYALTSGCFLLVFGRLADIFGRKYIFIAGCIWLIAFSVGCGVSPNAITLIIMRALAGMGAAAMTPASIGILAKTFPPSHARTVAFSIFQAGAPCGGAFGTVLAGVMTQFVPVESWRTIFFAIAFIGCIILIGGIVSLPRDHVDSSADRRVDWIGAGLVSTGLVLLMFCLGQGEIAPQQWNTGYIVGLLVTAMIIICAFVGWEHYVETRTTIPPLMRLNLWTRGRGKFAAVLLISFLVNGAFSTWQYWATLYYQNYLFLSPIDTTVRFIPMNIVGFSVNIAFAFVASYISGYHLIVCGSVATSIACLLFAVIDTSTTYWAFGFPAAVLDVVGADIIMAGGSLFVAKVALPHEQSLAGGVFNTIVQLGIAFATTVTTVVYDNDVRTTSAQQGVQLNQFATNATPTSLLHGYRMAQWATFAFAMFAAIVAAISLRGIGVIGTPTESKAPIVESTGTQEKASQEATVDALPR